MKNDIIRFENNVPDNYLVGSRDYQALLRLFTFGISSIKFDVDNIRYVNDASHINSRLLNLLKLKVGFFTKEEFKDQYIREVLKVFSLIVKKKGTRQAIYDAINLYFRACRYNGDYVVEINNKDDIQPYMIRIGVTKESNDILLLEEILKYILPTGYLYEVFKYSTAKYKSNYYTQDQLTLSVVDDYNGSNIHSNSSNIFIEKLYEGISVGPASIITITDGADNTPLKSAVVNIEPVQDLHGYDYPWPAGGGKNQLGYMNNVVTQSGVTLTAQTDGTLLVNGTATVNAAFIFNATVAANHLTLAPGTYVVSGFEDYNNANCYIGVNVNSESGAYTATSKSTASFTVAQGDYVYPRIRIASGASFTNYVLKPMIRLSSAPSAWEPYSNICPISGWSEVDMWQTGTNVWDEEWEVGGYSSSTGNKITQNNTIRSKNQFAVAPNTAYYFNTPYSIVNYGIWLFFYDSAGVYHRSYQHIYTASFTTPQDAYYMTFELAATYGTTYNNDVSVNHPATDRSYHSYNGIKMEFPLGRTIEEGYLKPLTGQLHESKRLMNMSDLTWQYNATYHIGYTYVPGKAAGRTNFLTSICKTVDKGYATMVNGEAAGTAGDNGINIRLDSTTDLASFQAAIADETILFDLATPQEYNLTPQTIKTLKGTNNFWADAGEMSIEYLSETDGGSYITYYNVYNNVTDDYINILTYPSVDDIELYNGDFTVSISETDFDLDNANMYVLIHQYLKDDRIVCSNTTWSISYDAQTDSITATSGNNEINISYSNFIRNLPLLEDHEIPSSFTLEYENERISTEGFVLQDDNRSFTFTGYDGNKIIVKYETDSQYLGKRIDNVVVYKNGWENESN